MDQPTQVICPHCGAVIEVAGVAKHPQGFASGDYFLCVHCAEVSTFNPDLTLRRATYEDWMTMQLKGKGLFEQIDKQQNEMRRKLMRKALDETKNP